MAPQIYQLKITLLQVSPKIWRRVLVPEDFTFWDLRGVIEDAMKVSVSKLHYFQTKDPKSGHLQCISFRRLDCCSCPYVNGSNAFVRDYFASPADNAIFDQPEYGNWAFNVELEKISAEFPGIKYPRCVDGERAGPPNKAKGVLHFKEFLNVFEETRDDRDEKREAAMKRWMGKSFQWKEYNPDIFNSNLIKFRYTVFDKCRNRTKYMYLDKSYFGVLSNGYCCN